MGRLLLLLAAAGLARAALTPAQHREEGNKLLKQADFNTALDHFHAACEGEADNFENFYKRATVFLATGRTRQAIRDLTTVLDLKPELGPARARRAELLVKEGSFERAREDYKAMSGSPDSQAQLTAIDVAEQLIANGRQLLASGDPKGARDAFTQAIETVPSSPDLRLLRAQSFMALGQTGEAVGDVMRASKLRSNDPDAFHLLSQLHFRTGARNDALAAIRECVKLDADHKACFALYKKLKKFVKAYDSLEEMMQKKQYQQALEQLEKCRKHENSEIYFLTEYSMVECECFTSLGDHEKAMAACTRTLELSPRRVDALLFRATVHEAKEEFEKAIEDLKQADEIEEKSQRIQERLQRAERLLKQSKKRDYYKILGVSRTANKREITKAYRDMAQKWHPDKFETEADKKMAEGRFFDIAAAKEVLTDPEKRRMFDNGEDPLDAEEERDRNRGGFNPFGGFHHHGGGGQRFHFRYQ